MTSGIVSFRREAASRRARQWPRQSSKPGAPFEVEEQARRQGREHGRGRHAGGIDQARGPMIADVEEMERAVGAKEQTRAVEAGPELLRQRACVVAGKARVELVGEAREAGIAELEAH